MTIRITENKSKRPVSLPLNQYAAQLIESRYLSRAKSDYVFSYNNTHLKSIRKCLARHAPELAAHDLRRTFLTAGDSQGVGHYVLKLLVNHAVSKSDVTAGYITSDFFQMREASNKIASKLHAQ
jgi:integrase